jgi:plastocyanin
MRLSLIALGVIATGAALLLPGAVTTAGASTKPTNFTISMVGPSSTCSIYCFTPANPTIRQGDTVTFKNVSATTHTAQTCTTGACNGVGPGTGTDPAFNSSFIGPTGKFVVQFHGVGSYNYYCMVHGYGIMHGTITVKPMGVGTSSLPGGTVGQAYSAQLKTAGGQPPFTWSVLSGTLPHGLTLSSTGLISGSPTATGTSTFKVQVTDSSSPALMAKRSLSITVS